MNVESTRKWDKIFPTNNFFLGPKKLSPARWYGVGSLLGKNCLKSLKFHFVLHVLYVYT